MADEETWSQRLEKCAIVSLAISIFGSIPGIGVHNVAVAAIVLYAAYTRNGRVNAVTLLVVILSLLTDISICGLYAKDWGKSGHEHAFGLAMLIVNLFVKLLMIACHYNLYMEFGGSFGLSFPSGGLAPQTTTYRASSIGTERAPFGAQTADFPSAYQSSGSYQGVYQAAPEPANI
eukprot:TRINITY_DN224_c0_g2_i1.p1 TRINITY_DN224_c0_g2~~TRINITY_DN224_c0_g2_i1.p1  ORF type:complete len:200 (-),score=77.30 TRINITY_DN224_c0_g2_i1:234-761(-)